MGQHNMLKELKQAAIWGAMMLVFFAPCGVYLMSFRGEGLLGEVLGYGGAFIVLPMWLLYRNFGIPSWVYLAIGLLALYLWFVFWAALLRWLQRRKLAAAGKPG